MNKKSSTDKGKASADDSERSSELIAGQRLAEARRAHDLSIAEIAKELHLDEHKVKALEENRFDVLGPPVFAKGHLKKYAELVAVPLDDMLADYYKLNKAAGAPPVVGPKKQRPPRTIAPVPWIIGILIVIVAAALLAWWFNREPATETGGIPGVLEPAVPDRDTAIPNTATNSPPVNDPAIQSEDTPQAVLDEEQLPTTEQVIVAEDLAETTQDIEETLEGGILLIMTFSGDCWTEVTDANGDRLFFGLGQAGQTVSRAGMPPLQALFGDHNNVSLTVDGVNLPLSSNGRRGNTARLTIESP
jgi:cytoskeleton protein RodZ